MLLTPSLFGMVLSLLFAFGANQASENTLRLQIKWIAAISVIAYLIEVFVLAGLNEL